MRWICTPAGIIRSDDHVLGVRARVRLAGGHGRGCGRRRVQRVVQDLRHRRRGLRSTCAAGLHPHLLRVQASHVRYPRVGVGDVGVGAGGARVYSGAGRVARTVCPRVRHLPVLPRGSAVLWGDRILHPGSEQLLLDAEERRGHGGPAQVRLLDIRAHQLMITSHLDSHGLTTAPNEENVRKQYFVFRYEGFVATD